MLWVETPLLFEEAQMKYMRVNLFSTVLHFIQKPVICFVCRRNKWLVSVWNAHWTEMAYCIANVISNSKKHTDIMRNFIQLKQIFQFLPLMVIERSFFIWEKFVFMKYYYSRNNKITLVPRIPSLWISLMTSLKYI